MKRQVAGTAKRADQVADRIAEDIAALGSPVGQKFATLSELMKRYGAGSAAIREAARMLERREIARMRSGPAGGLIISGPGYHAVARVIAMQIEMLRPDVATIHDLLGDIESLVVAQVIERASPEQLDVLHVPSETEVRRKDPAALVAMTTHFSNEMARLAGSRMLAILADVLQLLRTEFVYILSRMEPREEMVHLMVEHRRQIFRCMKSGDLHEAMARTWVWYKRTVPDILERFGATKIVGERSIAERIAEEQEISRVFFDQRCTLSEALARLISRAIRQADLKPGRFLGSEADWSGRYGMARPAIREALRVLEADGFIEVRRGKEGGAFVSSPDIDRSLAIVSGYLGEADAGEDADIILRTLAPSIAATAAQADIGSEVLGAIAQGDFGTLGMAAGDRVRGFLLKVVDRACKSSPVAQRRVRDGWQALIDAIVAGDSALSARSARAMFPMRFHAAL